MTGSPMFNGGTNQLASIGIATHASSNDLDRSSRIQLLRIKGVWEEYSDLTSPAREGPSLYYECIVKGGSRKDRFAKVAPDP